MAAPGAGDPLDATNGNTPFAQGIDPSREKLTPAQLQFMRQVQLAQWQKTLPQQRTRNVVTGLGIWALVLAIYGYTFYSVAQERFLDELEDEAKAARARALERESVRTLTVRTIFKLLEPLYMLNDAGWSHSIARILISDYA